MYSSVYTLVLFFFLACAITWLLDLPWVLACLRHESPPEWALLLTGLGAWGPTLAALVVAARSRTLREVFGRWRTKSIWIPIALLLPAAIHLPATLIEVALGGRPQQWFYPPTQPELVVAMVMFSFGEEFGWRGLAHPRAVEKLGPILGPLVVGAVWGLWHLGMMFTPDHGAPEASTVAIAVAELSLYSIVVAWIFEKSGRSMWVAIAIHMGGHLDNVNRAPEGEIRLRVLRFAVLVVVVGLISVSGALRSADRGPTISTPQ
jgi:uncharacterized protein